MHGELMNDPFLRKRGMFATVEHPVRGEVVIPGWPVKMSDTKVTVEAAPLLGADNTQVYGDWLGLGERELGALKAKGVI